MPTVNIVTHEQIISVWQFASETKEFFQVMKLPVNISANGHRRSDRLHILFFAQNFFGFLAQLLNFCFSEWDALQKFVNSLILLRYFCHQFAK